MAFLKWQNPPGAAAKPERAEQILNGLDKEQLEQLGQSRLELNKWLHGMSMTMSNLANLKMIDLMGARPQLT